MIHRYAIGSPNGGQQVKFIDMPKGAEILSAQAHKGVINIWADVDREQPLEQRKFLMLFTGSDDRSPGAKFIGTVIGPIGLVYHVFACAM